MDDLIRKTLRARAEEVEVPPDAWRRMKKDWVRPGPWQRLRMGRRLEVAAAVLLLLAVVGGLTALRQFSARPGSPPEVAGGGVGVGPGPSQTGQDALSDGAPDLAEVSYGQIDGYLLDLTARFEADHPVGRTVLQKVLRWLDEAKPIRTLASPDELDLPKNQTARLLLALKESPPAPEEFLSARLAYECGQATDGATNCRIMEGHVVVARTGTYASVLVYQPQLAAWLQQGWVKEPLPFTRERVELPRLDLEAIDHLRFHAISPDRQEFRLTPTSHPEELKLLVEAFNAAGEAYRRDVGTTPPYTVDVNLVDGGRITLSPAGEMPVMATVGGEALWIDSPYLAKVLSLIDHVAEQAAGK